MPCPRRCSSISTPYLRPPRWKRRSKPPRRSGPVPNLQDLVKLEIDGFRIGRNVQSLELRRFRVGRLDDADPRDRQATRNTLMRSLAAKHFAEAMMDDRAPDIAVFIERGYTPAGETSTLACCAAWTRSTVRGAAVRLLDLPAIWLGSRGEHPLALSDVLWQRLLVMPWARNTTAPLPNASLPITSRALGTTGSSFRTAKRFCRPMSFAGFSASIPPRKLR